MGGQRNDPFSRPTKILLALQKYKLEVTNLKEVGESPT